MVQCNSPFRFGAGCGKPCREKIQCTRCIDGTVAPHVGITLPSLFNSNCVDCGDFGATFLVPYDPIDDGVGGIYCRWLKRYEPGDAFPCIPASGYARLMLELFDTSMRVTLEMWQGPSGDVFRWSNNDDLPPYDCDFSGTVFPFFDSSIHLNQCILPYPRPDVTVDAVW